MDICLSYSQSFDAPELYKNADAPALKGFRWVAAANRLPLRCGSHILHLLIQFIKQAEFEENLIESGERRVTHALQRG